MARLNGRGLRKLTFRFAVDPATRAGALLGAGLLSAMLITALTNPASAQGAPLPTAAATSITIPALTPVEIEILVDLGSKTSKTGQIFPLRLAQPIVIDGRIVVPAGATGNGEVLDAKRGGMSGSSGVLILIAHDLAIDGRSLRLRSMHIAQTGDDHRTAAAVTGVLVGVFGLLVTGGETKVTAGTHALAKTADDFVIAPVNVAAPTPPTTEGTTR